MGRRQGRCESTLWPRPRDRAVPFDDATGTADAATDVAAVAIAAAAATTLVQPATAALTQPAAALALQASLRVKNLRVPGSARTDARWPTDGPREMASAIIEIGPCPGSRVRWRARSSDARGLSFLHTRSHTRHSSLVGFRDVVTFPRDVVTFPREI
eukprot:scaffold32615_cov70-Phaeocystis_antarctica.AAC.4